MAFLGVAGSWLRATRAFVLLGATIAIIDCAASSAGLPDDDDDDDDGSAGAASHGSGGGGPSTATVSASSGIFSVGGSGGSSAPPPILYAHADHALYRADPTADPFTLSPVGEFDCVGGAGESASMTDLAVDASGTLWSISTKNVYRLEITSSSVHCAAITPLKNPKDIKFYGLTFAPKGVLNPDKEVLVAGNTAGELWAIDPQGNLSLHGTLGVVPADDGHGHAYANAGKVWELSGDIVFLAHDGDPVGFATVRDCPMPPSPDGCNPVDTLVELDIAALGSATTQSVVKSVRGQVLKGAGCSDGVSGPYGNIYGIAAHQDSVYGFTRLPSGGGYVVDISNVDGTACLIQPTSDIEWYGAGITTLADIEPPPPT